MESGIGLGDLLAVMNSKNNEGFGGSWMWVIFLFFIFAIFFSGGGLFANRDSSPATTAFTSQEFTLGNIENGIRGIQQGICDSTYALNNSLNNLGSQMQQCCCDTQKEIIESRYQTERSACDIINAIHADGEATRGLITQNTIQSLRDELQAAQLQLGNVAQTQTLINQLKPFPIPAYITCSPYASASNCGCCMA